MAVEPGIVVAGEQVRILDELGVPLDHDAAVVVDVVASVDCVRHLGIASQVEELLLTRRAERDEEVMLEILKDIKKDDWVLCSWRSHYQCLLKGVPRATVFDEILKGMHFKY